VGPPDAEMIEKRDQALRQRRFGHPITPSPRKPSISASP
jgi:hypothetical protein